MKKKNIILSSIFLSIGLVVSVFPFATKGNLFIKGEADDWRSHQIVFTAEDSSVESESLYTHYFKLHQDNATLSGYSIDSKPNECLIMADSETSAGGDHICYGVANPQSGTYACLYLTIPLTSIKSFTSVVFRGQFFRGYWDDEVNEIQFGSESYSTIWNEFEVALTKTYKVIILDEIEINYTCAV
ncbi:MAG: hypothetical protein SPL00_04215 [Bacilli bacterium]|nr:hypothetical protein [Bacilli bacterium]